MTSKSLKNLSNRIAALEARPARAELVPRRFLRSLNDADLALLELVAGGQLAWESLAPEANDRLCAAWEAAWLA